MAFPFDVAGQAARTGEAVEIDGEWWRFTIALTGPGPGPSDVAFRLEGRILAADNPEAQEGD